jgi:hypothetical protein
MSHSVNSGFNGPPTAVARPSPLFGLAPFLLRFPQTVGVGKSPRRVLPYKLAVGVGSNNEHALASVGRADFEGRKLIGTDSIASSS